MAHSTAVWQYRQLAAAFTPPQFPVTFGPDNIVSGQGGAAAAADANGISPRSFTIVDSIVLTEDLVNGQVTFTVDSILAGQGNENVTINVGTTSGGSDLYQQQNSPNRVGNNPGESASLTVPLSRTVLTGETIYVERKVSGGTVSVGFIATVEAA